jgi:hypothetical protein
MFLLCNIVYCTGNVITVPVHTLFPEPQEILVTPFNQNVGKDTSSYRSKKCNFSIFSTSFERDRLLSFFGMSTVHFLGRNNIVV